MINEIIHKITIQTKTKIIKISLNDFNKLDKIIKSKIVEKIYSFFQTKNIRIRNSKIQILLSQLNKKNVKSLNLSNLKIKKTRYSLDFLLNN